MITIGIDPGLHGAIAFFSPSALDVFDMPVVEVKRGGKNKSELDISALCNLLDLYAPQAAEAHAYVEQVGAMPGQGVTSMFAFGKGYGIVLGALTAMTIPVSHVLPRTWRSEMKVRDGKEGSILRASELFPHAAHLFRGPRGGPIDGRAEAVLIATYGARLNA